MPGFVLHTSLHNTLKSANGFQEGRLKSIFCGPGTFQDHRFESKDSQKPVGLVEKVWLAHTTD